MVGAFKLYRHLRLLYRLMNCLIQVTIVNPKDFDWKFQNWNSKYKGYKAKTLLLSKWSNRSSQLCSLLNNVLYLYLDNISIPLYDTAFWFDSLTRSLDTLSQEVYKKTVTLYY